MYVRHMAWQTAWWLGLCQVVLGCGLAAYSWLAAASLWHPAGWTILAALQLSVAIVVFGSLQRQLRTTKPLAAPGRSALASADMPSLTVAIPAHHPVEQLRACIDTVLASDYPKMEILVLDDHPHAKTPELTKLYAHAGVRFIRTEAIQDGWLAKNQAYAQLAAEASGELLMFCGPDIRFGRSSIRELVQLMVVRNKAMLCVLPLNTQATYVPLLQSMRYYWEMVPPRRLFKRPPVLGSCWLVRRAELDRSGGFAAVSRSITPEAHLARSLLADDAYSFIRSDRQLAISSQKSLAEQRATAIVTRYPQLHRRIELVALLTFVELLLVVVPLVLATIGWMLPIGAVCCLLAVAASILHCATFYRLQRAFFPAVHPLQAALGLYTAIAADIYQLHLSMWKYEFTHIIWRDREVTSQIMHRPAPPNSST